jgi:diphthine-ammonia ligase
VKVAVLYTGGKDSHYALLKALDQGHDVVCLITVVAKREDSYMFHTVNIKWSLLHGDAMGIPQYLVEVSGEKEREVEELALRMERLVQRCQLEGLVTGAVASTYQKSRIDRITKQLGLVHIAPLWGYDQEKLLREEAEKLRFIITAAMAMGLGPQHLGRIVTPEVAEEIITLSKRYGFSPVGEGGEFETFVVESPLFALEIVSGEVHWHPSGWGYYEIKEAKIRRGRWTSQAPAGI